MSSCNGVSITKTDQILISCHQDGHLRASSPNSGKVIQNIPISEFPFTSCSISNNDIYVACSGANHVVWILDIRTYEILHKFRHEDYSYAGKYSKLC